MPKDENPSVKCECGCQVNSRCLHAHQQSTKHHRYMEMKEQGVQPKTGYERRQEICRCYVEKNRDKIAERMKTYRESHQEKIIEQNRSYKACNRDKILEQRKSYQSRKITCECGCDVARNDLSKHLQTLKHLRLVEQKAKGDEAEPEPAISEAMF